MILALPPVALRVVGLGLGGIEEAERRPDVVELPDAPGGEKLVDPGDCRMMPVHEPFDDQRAGFIRGPPDLERFRAGERERFLAENVPGSGLEAAEHMVAMQIRPRGDEYGVELVLANHRQIVDVRALAPVAAAPLLRDLWAHVATGHDRHGVRRGRPFRMALGNAATTDDSDPEGPGARHQTRRLGSKGASSGAARPSSTSGARRAAVAGASVTPSMPWPVAT